MTKKTVVISIIVVIIGLGVIGAANPQPTNQTKEPTVSKQHKTDLAQEVQKAFLGMYGANSVADLKTTDGVGYPENQITSFENLPHNSVQANVGVKLSNQEATNLARTIAESAIDTPNLETVWVQGTTGNISYVNLSSLKQ